MSSGATTKTRTDGSLIGDSAAGATWTLISRITGFGRVLLLGAVFGPSYLGNLFQLANQLPWITFELAVGALLHALIIPALVEPLSAGRLEDAQRLAGGFLTVVMAAFAVITIAVMAASWLVAGLLASPIDDAAQRADYVRLGVPLLLLTAPQLVGYGIAITGQAVQQAMGSFALPAAASIIENVVVIATLIVFAVLAGGDVTLDTVAMEHIILLGVGSSLGVIAHAAVQLYGVRRLGFRLRPNNNWRSSQMASIWRQAKPSSATAALNGLRYLVLFVSCNAVPGGVVALQFALNMLNLPVALVSKPIAYALLPRLALQFKNRDMTSMAETYMRSVGMAALVAVPAAIATLSLGWFAGPGFAVGQMANGDGPALLMAVLTGIAGAVLGEGLFQLLTSATFAMDDARSTFHGYAVRFAITVALALVASASTSGVTRVFAIVVAMSLGDLIASVALHLRIARSLPGAPYHLKRSVAATAATAGVPFALVSAALWWTFGPQPSLSAVAVLAVTAAASASALTLFGLARWWVDSEMADLVATMRSGQPVAVTT